MCLYLLALLPWGVLQLPIVFTSAKLSKVAWFWSNFSANVKMKIKQSCGADFSSDKLPNKQSKVCKF